MLIKIGILVGFVSAIMGLFPPAGTASFVPFLQQRQMIQEIARDTSTPEKKAAAVAKLMAIVGNPEEDINLREFAVRYLGDMGAVQAEGVLKDVAETLPWVDPFHRLKQYALLAYWKIKVASEPNKDKQVQLLTQLLHERFKDGMIANNVQTWAAEELADRGVKEALPEIIKSVKDRGGSDNIWLYTTKIELLSTSASRQEALSKALTADDPTQEQFLKQWAIEGLAALNTQEARMILLNYALGLRNKYYDAAGKAIRTEDGRLPDGRALEFYRYIVINLQDSGTTDTELRDVGLIKGIFIRNTP